MRNNLKGRDALYREGCELFWVQIIDQEEDDWGVALTVKVMENRFASVNEELDINYCSKSSYQEVFTVSGAWEVVSFTDDIFYISYVGVKINFRKSALDAFKRNEKDLFEMWNRID